jgi:acyl carrier protein
MSDIATRVKKIIVDKLGVDEAEVTNPDEQAETITTVGQAVAYLEEHAK